MNFSSTPDREMLKDAVRRSVQEICTPALLRENAAADRAFIEKNWRLAADLGWTGMLIAPEYGGLGLGLADGVVLGEEMGRSLFAGPFISTAVLAAGMIAQFAPAEWRGSVLQAIANGSMRIALAWLDTDAQWLCVKPSIRVVDGAFHGRKLLSEHAATATHILLIDIVPRGANRHEISAFLIPSSAAGLAIRPQEPFDITSPVATVDCAGTEMRHAQSFSARLPEGSLSRVLAPARLMACAELVGVAGAALDLATAYARERKQFGAPIGSFQAIKHKLANASLAVDGARLAVHYAAQAYDEASPSFPLAMEAAWASAAEGAIRVTGDCIQVHGGLGFSWEHEAHLYFKRARRLSAFVADSQSAREVIATAVANSVNGEIRELFPAIL